MNLCYLPARLPSTRFLDPLDLVGIELVEDVFARSEVASQLFAARRLEVECDRLPRGPHI